MDFFVFDPENPTPIGISSLPIAAFALGGVLQKDKILSFAEVKYDNGKSETVKLTCDMLDLDGVETTGEKTYKISYGDKIGREGTLQIYN